MENKWRNEHSIRCSKNKSKFYADLCHSFYLIDITHSLTFYLMHWRRRIFSKQQWLLNNWKTNENKRSCSLFLLGWISYFTIWIKVDKSLFLYSKLTKTLWKLNIDFLVRKTYLIRNRIVLMKKIIRVNII